MGLFVHPEAEKVRKFSAASVARMDKLVVGRVDRGHVAPEGRRVELHLANLKVESDSRNRFLRSIASLLKSI